MQTSAQPIAGSAPPANPFLTWLQSLRHDGVPRIQRWLPRALYRTWAAGKSGQSQEYLSQVGEHALLGHVARAVHPGCEFPYVVYLHGAQGTGKTRLLATLFGPAFLGSADHDLKGLPKIARGAAAIEMGEMNLRERSALKGMITASSDSYRAPYARESEIHPRAFIVWCTGNRDFISDEAGDRRFWPVQIDRDVDIAYVDSVRTQLWAEAFRLYMQGRDALPSQPLQSHASGQEVASP